MALSRPFVRTAAAVVGAVALTASLAAAPAGAAPKAERGLIVMTRNLYLGGDIGAPIAAALGAGTDPFAVLVAFGNANAELWQTVQSTAWPTRSRLLARELAAERPDLVGLQEVSEWRTGPLELDDIGTPDAAEPVYDFLASLVDDVAALGVPYEVVRQQVQSDVEGPAFSGPNPFAAADGQDVRLTMRDVVLRRVGSEAVVQDSGSGQYAAKLTVPVAGRAYSFVRGWVWADATFRGEPFRFVNTHLESQYSYLAAQQAGQLLAPGGAAAVTDRPVVLVCDCNSDPLDGSQKTVVPGVLDVPHWTAYRLLTGAGGFTDAWLARKPAQVGWTSGLSETVDDTPAEANRRFDHRIDLVLVRGVDAVTRSTVVGTDPSVRNRAGVWPSDHAGVVVTLQP